MKYALKQNKSLPISGKMTENRTIICFFSWNLL